MRAVVYREYGSPEVLSVEDIDPPTPQDGELLIEVHAASVSSSDVTFRSGRPFIARSATGFTKPKKPVLGSELAGRVEAVGPGVTRFKPGDRVAAASAADFGGYADYICVPEDGALVALPDDLGYQDAVGIFEGTLTALPFLRDTGHIRSGQRVLINGASGSVGTAAIQLAKHFGAEVTAVASGANAELVRSLGSDHFIDYRQEDFTKGGQAYDIGPDGSRLASASVDGTVRVWALEIDDLIAIAEEKLTRELTPAECLEFLHLAACPGP